MKRQKINFFVSSLAHYTSNKDCPFCGSSDVSIDDRKYLVSRLFECNSCHLKFRHPKDDQRTNFEFYTNEYEETDGITTDLPSKDELQQLVDSRFAGSPKNADRYIDLFKSLAGNDSQPLRVLDFGANWGYTSVQFKNTGFEVEAYEISKPRASYGTEHLGVNIHTDLDKVSGKFDFIFSAHVIEHLPDINVLFDLASQRLKPGGFLVTLCPNGSNTYKKSDPEAYHRCWGLVHPNYISDEFFTTYFKDQPYYIGSGDDLSPVATWDQKSQVVSEMNEWEFFSVVRY